MTTQTLLPTRKELFTRILADAEGREEHPEAFDRAIAYAEIAYQDFSYEDIIECANDIMEGLYGFVHGYLSK